MKNLAVLAVGLLLVLPSVSFAQYHQDPITNTLILLLKEKVSALQEQLERLQDMEIELERIEKEQKETKEEEERLRESYNKIEKSIDWATCYRFDYCIDKVKRLNEITKKLGYGCSYEVGKYGIGKSCGA